MKKKLVVIIGLLIAMNIVTMTSCGRKSKIVNDGNNVELSKNFKQDKKNNTIIWFALLTSLLVNAGFTVICISRINERSRNRYDKLRDKIDRLENNNHLNNHQNVKTVNTVSSYKLSDDDINLIVEKVRNTFKLSDKDINLIVDRALECIDLSKKEQVDAKENKDSTNPSVPKVIKTLYASAVKEKDNMCFVDVYEQPKEKTIYILSVTDENNAKFVLFEKAKEIVVGCEDYINNACNKSGNGSNIESCEPGVAERTSDGTWKVVKKANVKFV